MNGGGGVQDIVNSTQDVVVVTCNPGWGVSLPLFLRWKRGKGGMSLSVGLVSGL